MTSGAFNLGDVGNPTTPAGKVAVTDLKDWDRPHVITHAELDAACDAAARGFVDRGLKRGDAIAILSSNRHEFLIAYFGAMRAGFVAVPVNDVFPRETIAYILADAAIKLIVCDAFARSRLSTAIPITSFDDPGNEGFNCLLSPGPFEPVRPEQGETAMILYTSGSSGKPKGVPLSHESHLWCVRRRVAAGQFENERLLIAAPLFHMNGLCTAKFVVGAGSEMVLLPRFEAKRYLEAAARFRCTWLTGVPAMYAMLSREQETLQGLDLSHVKYVRLGSAPSTQKLINDIRAIFPTAAVAIGYGTTEVGPVVFGPHPEGLPKPDLALGWPAPEVSARFLTPEMEAAGEGVLALRTPANMSGYLNLPQKTAEVMKADGHYVTGDIFRRSPEGYFTFVSRADDMINCGGEKLSPVEIETLIERHPAVAQASVVPVPDEIKGQKPVAFVVLKKGAIASEDDIKSFALANGPAYAHPRHVKFMSELPLVRTNKIDRNTLKTLAGQEWPSEVP